MKNQIQILQKKLRLSSSLMEIYPEIKAENHEDFLYRLLKELDKDREEKRIIRNLNNAGFPLVKSLANYDHSQITFPETFNFEELDSLEFVKRKENLIFYGSVGTGKTHLAIALGIKAINQGEKAVFYRLHDLINLLEEGNEKRVERLKKKIKEADLLILDEWGYLPLHQEGARLVFDIISDCYERKSIILTTNIEFSRWKGFLFDEKLTAAILDRLIHHSHMLLFTGKSYRMTHSLMN